MPTNSISIYRDQKFIAPEAPYSWGPLTRDYIKVYDFEPVSGIDGTGHEPCGSIVAPDGWAVADPDCGARRLYPPGGDGPGYSAREALTAANARSCGLRYLRRKPHRDH